MCDGRGLCDEASKFTGAFQLGNLFADFAPRAAFAADEPRLVSGPRMRSAILRQVLVSKGLGGLHADRQSFSKPNSSGGCSPFVECQASGELPNSWIGPRAQQPFSMLARRCLSVRKDVSYKSPLRKIAVDHQRREPCFNVLISKMGSKFSLDRSGFDLSKLRRGHQKFRRLQHGSEREQRIRKALDAE